MTDIQRNRIAAKLLAGSLAGTLALAAPAANAMEVSVEITNLTNAIHFTPLLVALHGGGEHLFSLGHPASMALQAMAEGGDIAPLEMELDQQGATYVGNPAGGLLAPGASATTMLDTARGLDHLSIVGMLLPTNDGFVGLDSMPIPRSPGVYTWYLNGYDAGTEGNDEIVNGGGAPGTPGIPADPTGYGGSGGSGVAMSDFNPMVHIHPGVVGDADPNGGRSDLDPAVHAWLNPVAKVVVRVPPEPARLLLP